MWDAAASEALSRSLGSLLEPGCVLAAPPPPTVCFWVWPVSGDSDLFLCQLQAPCLSDTSLIP